jgi:hypothetical protein
VHFFFFSAKEVKIERKVPLTISSTITMFSNIADELEKVSFFLSFGLCSISFVQASGEPAKFRQLAPSAVAKLCLDFVKKVTNEDATSFDFESLCYARTGVAAKTIQHIDAITSQRIAKDGLGSVSASASGARIGTKAFLKVNKKNRSIDLDLDLDLIKKTIADARLAFARVSLDGNQS